jgi:hypothetical protein
MTSKNGIPAIVADGAVPSAPTEAEYVGKWITRVEAGEYLKREYRFGSASTLGKLAMKSGGPKFHKYGTKRSLYKQSDLDNWALAEPGDARSHFPRPEGAPRHQRKKPPSCAPFSLDSSTGRSRDL